MAVALLAGSEGPALAGEGYLVRKEPLVLADDQRALFLQHTAGDLDSALAAYARALEARPPPGREAALQLGRAEAFAWRGDRAGAASALEAVRRLGREAGGPVGWIGLPAGSDLVLALDLVRLGQTPWGEALGADGEGARALARRVGFFPGRQVKRAVLALELVDGVRPLDGWLLALEGELGDVRPGGLLAVLGEVWRRNAPALERAATAELALDGGRARGGLALQVDLEALHGNAPEATWIEERIEGVEVAWTAGGPLGADGRPRRLGLARLAPGPEGARLLLGEEANLRRGLRVLAGAAPDLRANPRLWALVEQVESDSALALLAVPQALVVNLRGLGLDSALKGGLVGLSGLLLTARAGHELELAGVAFGEDAESLRILGDLARGALALVRLASAEEAAREPALAALLSGLVVETREQSLRVQVRLPFGLLGDLK
jgi:hypothetical protein